MAYVNFYVFIMRIRFVLRAQFFELFYSNFWLLISLAFVYLYRAINIFNAYFSYIFLQNLKRMVIRNISDTSENIKKKKSILKLYTVKKFVKFCTEFLLKLRHFLFFKNSLSEFCLYSKNIPFYDIFYIICRYWK